MKRIAGVLVLCLLFPASGLRADRSGGASRCQDKWKECVEKCRRHDPRPDGRCFDRCDARRERCRERD